MPTIFFVNCFAYYFFKVHLHQSLQIKSHKTLEIKGFLSYYFCLIMEVSTESGTGSVVPLINGSGSGTLVVSGCDPIKCALIMVQSFLLINQRCGSVLGMRIRIQEE
jgi:hypothetical protein